MTYIITVIFPLTTPDTLGTPSAVSVCKGDNEIVPSGLPLVQIFAGLWIFLSLGLDIYSNFSKKMAQNAYFWSP